MEELRCGLVGCGVISGTHIEALESIDCANLVAVCDVRPERLENLLDKNPHLNSYLKLGDMLKDSELDVVIVCTDHASHVEVAIEAFESGCHVICEKPLTACREELNHLLQVRQTHPDLKAGGIFQNRFNPSFRAFHEMIQDGKIGKVLNLGLLHRCNRTESYYAKDDWRGTLEREGGSSMINQSIHFVDYLLQIGGEVDQCSGFEGNLTKRGLIETEDVFAGCLRFKSGALGSINLTNASSESWVYRLTVAGEKGTLELVDGKIMASAGLKWEEEKRRLDEALETESPGGEGKSYYGGYHRQNLMDFFSSILDGKTLEVSMESQATTTAVVHELYRAAREGQVKKFKSPC